LVAKHHQPGQRQRRDGPHQTALTLVRQEAVVSLDERRGAGRRAPLGCGTAASGAAPPPQVRHRRLRCGTAASGAAPPPQQAQL